MTSSELTKKQAVVDLEFLTRAAENVDRGIEVDMVCTDGTVVALRNEPIEPDGTMLNQRLRLRTPVRAGHTPLEAEFVRSLWELRHGSITPAKHLAVAHQLLDERCQAALRATRAWNEEWTANPYSPATYPLFELAEVAQWRADETMFHIENVCSNKPGHREQRDDAVYLHQTSSEIVYRTLYADNGVPLQEAGLENPALGSEG